MIHKSRPAKSVSHTGDNPNFQTAVDSNEFRLILKESRLISRNGQSFNKYVKLIHLEHFPYYLQFSYIIYIVDINLLIIRSFTCLNI